MNKDIREMNYGPSLESSELAGLIVSKVFIGVVISPFMKCPNFLLFFDSHLRANSEDSKEGP